MTMNSMIQLFTLAASLTCAIWMFKSKSPKMMCLILTVYSILIAILISSILKLSLMPFIVILTMAGGLMILFLYFTASTNTKESKMKIMKADCWGPFFFVLMTTPQDPPPSPNTDPPLEEIIDPPTLLFTSQYSPLTLMIIILLAIMLVVVIYICSKSELPIRKKKSN